MQKDRARTWMKDIEQQHVGWRDSKIFGAEQENLTGSRSVDLKSWMNFGGKSQLASKESNEGLLISFEMGSWRSAKIEN